MTDSHPNSFGAPPTGPSGGFGSGRTRWSALRSLAVLALGLMGACAPMDPEPLRLDRVDAPGFEGAFRSPEALIESAVRLGMQGEPMEVFGMKIAYDEYQEILWPELPESAEGPPVDFYWGMMDLRHRKGARALVGELHGAPVEIVDIEWTDEPAVYPSFTIHKFPEVTVRRVDGGGEMVLYHITGIVEWNGLFKVFSFRD